MARRSLAEITGYTPPTLHKGAQWYIDFYCYDPVAGKNRRKKYMLDGIKKKHDRLVYAEELKAELTYKLRHGWNPWADDSNSRAFTRFNDVCDYYSRFIDKMEKDNAFKKKTAVDYRNRLKLLQEYNSNIRETPIIYIYQLDRVFLQEYLDYVHLDRDVTATTRNNHRTWLSAFCSWCIEKVYIPENPVDKIKVLPEKTKFRDPLPIDSLDRLRRYLEQDDRHFLLACMMEYYTFIRPDELTNIRIMDLYLKEQKVFISGRVSKNSKDGMVGLNDSIIKLMVDLKVFSSPGNYFLFGKHFRPAATKSDSRIFREKFAKVRDDLRWPESYQFYSLKDSGIRDLANSAGVVIARDQARHSDISVTNRYLKGSDLTVHEETKHFKGGL